ncbi:hypothetical protein HYV80_07475 [Candidatus Woesearchaeota archaeon]|nr:hypothetical protein [Candidatus Woesearchaeota archaeon]
MDIDEFLDRELSDLGLQTGTSEKKEDGLPPEDDGRQPLAQNISASIGAGNIWQAEQEYMQLWRALSGQKLKWNRELYEQLLALSRQFSGMLAQSYGEARQKSERVNEIIGRAKSAIQQGRKEAPFKLYSEAQEIFSTIPDAFFEEKRIIEAQIADFYRELKMGTDSELIKRTSSLISEINRLIEKISLAIRSNDTVNATVNYNKCIELYNQVPEGFLRHKNPIGMRILDIYRSLSIYNEISNLQKQLAQQPQNQQAIHQFSGNVPDAGALSSKKERAKRNMEKGFYNEAFKDIQEALSIEPNDAESKALHAKIKTLQ